MLEELREEEIVNKVGGRFKLSTLIQKRLLQLNQGSRALVDLDTQDRMKIAIQEKMSFPRCQEKHETQRSHSSLSHENKMAHTLLQAYLP